MNGETIRRATPADKDFIIDAIIEAEKSGSDIISYCSIFSISEAKLREVLSEMLDEDIEGQELCLSSYLVAEIDGERAATYGAWVEMESGMSSNLIKSNLFFSFLDRGTIINAAPNLKLMSEIEIHRDPHALQFEVSHTVPKFRGRGLYGKLANEHIRLNLERGAAFNKVQGIILKGNDNPVRALTKIGFHFVKEQHCSNSEILKLLPSDTKILMERTIVRD